MKIVTWNCQGAGKPSFTTHCIGLKHSYHPHVMVLMETKVAPEKAARLISRLGFTDHFRVPSVGFAGGLWVLWNSHDVNVEILAYSTQTVHALVTMNNERPWLFSPTYIQPNSASKTMLWDSMTRISNYIELPWLLAGDLNDMVADSEKQGGGPFNYHRARLFRANIDACRFLDLGFTGTPFTWFGKRTRGLLVRERLDRALANLEWTSRFPNSAVFHLPKVFSDHTPLLMDTDHSSAITTHRPFRFEQMWTYHADFSRLLTQTWNTSKPAQDNLGNFATELNQWKHDVFGNLYKTQRKLLSRLAGIQRSQAYPFNPFLLRLETDLLAQYFRTLHLEELHWFQKSRLQWMSLGDRNTTFYHQTTIARRRRNKILSLRLDDNKWCTDQEQLQLHATSHFHELFTAGDALGTQPSPLNWSTHARLTLDVGHFLTRRVEFWETTRAIKSMKSHSSPGPDGFPPGFFQHYWSIVGPSVHQLVVHAFATGTFDDTINSTHLVLIPKLEAPTMIHHFRPISLCNVLYKVITKVLVNRLKQFMPKLIHPLQAGFVPGRHATDNIIVAQELLHSMQRSKSIHGGMCIKVDLEKAYDKVNWTVLLDSLQLHNFPPATIQLISTCISTTQISVLWNGTPSNLFRPTRGLRQGDPLSPFLFVLYLERLSCMIETAVAARAWSPFAVCRGGPSISHLLFADDLLLFSKANPQQASVLMNVLSMFCLYTGQSVSTAKSSVFVSPRVPLAVRTRIKTATGLSLNTDLGKYLGVPLFHTRPSRQTFHFIVDKVQQRLSGWKARSLNMAGRHTLIQSVLAGLPTYTMQAFWLPQSTCDALNELNRKFLWGNMSDIRRVHTVNWKTVITSKRVGGLGLRDARATNTAQLAKLGARLASGSTSVWAQVLRAKYLRNQDPLDCIAKTGDSSMWKGIVRSFNYVKGGYGWQLGNGENISLWFDTWLPNDPLCLIIDNIHPSEFTWTVADLISHGHWDFSHLQTPLPAALKRTISLIPIPMVHTATDIRVWRGTSDGIPTSKSFFNFISIIADNSTSEDDHDPQVDWSWVWKLSCPQKLRFFVWLLAHDRLLTNVYRARIGIADNDRCPRCSNYSESALHLLRDCATSKEVWTALLPSSKIQWFFNLTLSAWIKDNLHDRGRIGPSLNKNWELLFAAAIWHLWKARNEVIFEDRPFYTPRIIRQILMYSMDMEVSLNRVLSYSVDPVNDHWSKPPPGYLKLNVDGGFLDLHGTYGGVLRDDFGVWQGGFSGSFLASNPLHTELMALYHGMLFLVKRGLTRVLIESDSSQAVNLILGHPPEDHPFLQLILDCKALHRQIWSSSVMFVSRVCNVCAHVMARLGVQFLEPTHVYFDVIPACLSEQVSLDMICN